LEGFEFERIQIQLQTNPNSNALSTQTYTWAIISYLKTKQLKKRIKGGLFLLNFINNMIHFSSPKYKSTGARNLTTHPWSSNKATVNFSKF